MEPEEFARRLMAINSSVAPLYLRLRASYPPSYDRPKNWLKKFPQEEEKKYFPPETGVLMFESKINLRGGEGSLLYTQAWIVPLCPAPWSYENIYFRVVIFHRKFWECFITDDLVRFECERLRRILSFFERKMIHEDVWPTADMTKKAIFRVSVEMGEKYPELCEPYLQAVSRFYDVVRPVGYLLPCGDLIYYLRQWFKEHGESVADKALPCPFVPRRVIRHADLHCRRVELILAEGRGRFRRLRVR